MALQCDVQQPTQLRRAFHPGGGTQAGMTLRRSLHEARKPPARDNAGLVPRGGPPAEQHREPSLGQPGAPATVFDMANFTAASPDHDAAFGKAVTAISEAAAEANKTGRPAHIVLNLEKNAIYRINLNPAVALVEIPRRL
jgi:hypothetical protein